MSSLIGFEKSGLRFSDKHILVFKDCLQAIYLCNKQMQKE